MASPVRMTLADAARALGTTPDALRQKIKRGKMMAVRDNTGRLLIEVDPDAPPAEQSSSRSDLTSTERQDGMLSHVKALADHVKTLTERLQAADKALADLRSDHAADVARIRADHAAEAQRLERQADAANARADEERIARADAESRADVERARLRVDHAAEIDRLDQQLLAAEVRADQADARTDELLNEIRALRAEVSMPWWRKLFRR